MPDFNLIVGCFCKFTFLRDSSLKRNGDFHVSCQRCFYISPTVKGSCVMVRVREKTLVNFARAEVSRIRIVFFLNLRCCGSLR